MTTDAKGRHTNIVEAQLREYVPVPGSPNSVLIGPGKLEVIRYPDGRVTGRILEGQSYDRELAIKHKLKRISWGV